MDIYVSVDDQLIFTDINNSQKHTHTCIFQDGTVFNCVRYPKQRLYVKWRGNEVEAELTDSMSIDSTPVEFGNAIYFKSNCTISKASFSPADGIVISHVRHLLKHEWIHPSGLCVRQINGYKFVYHLWDNPIFYYLFRNDVQDCTGELYGLQLLTMHRGKKLYVKRSADFDQPQLQKLSKTMIVVKLPMGIVPPRAWSHDFSLYIYVSNGNFVYAIDTDNAKLQQAFEVVNYHVISISGVYDGTMYAQGVRYIQQRGLYCFIAASLPIENDNFHEICPQDNDSSSSSQSMKVSRTLSSPAKQPLINVDFSSVSSSTMSGRVNSSKLSSEFLIEKEIGSGTYGKVFKVKHLYDEETYAVKQISLMHNVEKINNTFGEAKKMAKLNHPGIVRYHNTWIEKASYKLDNFDHSKGSLGELSMHFASENPVFIFIQMEFCNKSLEDWLRLNTKYRNQRQIRSWFKQIVLALQYIHSNNIFHRDLKPSNILVFSEETVKICDLGIATFSIMDDGETSMRWRSNTGTDMYKAPEQNFVYDEKVDIFSLGLILLELCVPMTVDQRMDIFLDVRCHRPLSVLRNQPVALDLITKLTKPNKDLRPTFHEILSHPFFTEILMYSE